MESAYLSEVFATKNIPVVNDCVNPYCKCWSIMMSDVFRQIASKITCGYRLSGCELYPEIDIANRNNSQTSPHRIRDRKLRLGNWICTEAHGSSRPLIQRRSLSSIHESYDYHNPLAYIWHTWRYANKLYFFMRDPRSLFADGYLSCEPDAFPRSVGSLSRSVSGLLVGAVHLDRVKRINAQSRKRKFWCRFPNIPFVVFKYLNNCFRVLGGRKVKAPFNSRVVSVRCFFPGILVGVWGGPFL